MPPRPRLIATLALALALAPAGTGAPVAARDIYVDGLDGDDGRALTAGTTPDDSFRTINRAIAAAGANADPDNRIYVLQGQYPDPVVVPASLTRPLTIKGVGEAVVKPAGLLELFHQGGDTGVLVEAGAPVTLDGLTLRQWANVGLRFRGAGSGNVRNCRLVDNNFGVILDSPGPLAISSSLVARIFASDNSGNSNAIRTNAGTTDIRRCTLAGNATTLFANAFIRVRNSILTGVTPGSVDSDFNDRVLGRLGPNDIAVDPQFLGGSEQTMFLLKPTSPLVAAGNEGGVPVTIGAYGVGKAARGTAADPAVAFTDFHRWMEPSGVTAGAAGSSFAFDAAGRIQLTPDLAEGTLRSPLLDLGAGDVAPFPFVKSITFKAIESADSVVFVSGTRRVVDSVLATRQREIAFRLSDTPYDPLAADPPFQNTFKGGPLNDALGVFTTGADGSVVFRPGAVQNPGRYLQVQVTLRRAAK